MAHTPEAPQALRRVTDVFFHYIHYKHGLA